MGPNRAIRTCPYGWACAVRATHPFRHPEEATMATLSSSSPGSGGDCGVLEVRTSTEAIDQALAVGAFLADRVLMVYAGRERQIQLGIQNGNPLRSLALCAEPLQVALGAARKARIWIEQGDQRLEMVVAAQVTGNPLVFELERPREVYACRAPGPSRLRVYLGDEATPREVLSWHGASFDLAISQGDPPPGGIVPVRLHAAPGATRLWGVRDPERLETDRMKVHLQGDGPQIQAQLAAFRCQTRGGCRQHRPP